jgi:hypothetical protein
MIHSAYGISMKLIHYAGEILVTSDVIADAVLRYAGVLAQHNGSATVTIPVRLDDGTVVDADMLIGPTSQLVAVPHETDADELIDEEVLMRISDEIARLAPSHPVTASFDDDYEIKGTPSDWEL